MHLVVLQFDIVWENKAANFATVERLLGNSHPAKNTLVVLPEMFATGFSMNTDTVAEDYNGETEKFLARTAKQFGVFLMAGAAMRGRDQRVRNKALIFSPAGELLAFYAKMRPFTPGGEAKLYNAGERTATFQWGECMVSPFVCYDLRFPELFREATRAKKPELFVVIANWPEKRIQHWVTLLQARAIENQAYVAGANRIGTDPFYTYTGRSIIVNPMGEIIADAGGYEGRAEADLDLPGLRKYRTGLPFLEDMGVGS